MKTAIISDLHLKENDRPFFKTKREELVKQEIGRIVSENDITAVVFNGDTFNESRLSASGYAINFFKNHIVLPLLEAGKEIHILVGNHERTTGGDVFNLIKGISHPLIFIHSHIEYREFETHIGVFVPFLYPGDFEVKTILDLEEEAEKYIKELLSSIKEQYPEKPIILFNHNIMTDGLPFDNGREVNMKFMEYPNVDFVFGGHIHKHEEFERGMYVGSFMKSFVYTEEDEGYVVFEIKNNEVLYERRMLKSYNYEKLYIDDYINFDFNSLEENTVYDIEVMFDIGVDESFFISELVEAVTSKGSYVKNSQVKRKDLDNGNQSISNIFTTAEEILADYLRENNIKNKTEKERLYEKLRICQEMAGVEHQAEVDKSVEKNLEKSMKTINNLGSLIREDRKL